MFSTLLINKPKGSDIELRMGIDSKILLRPASLKLKIVVLKKSWWNTQIYFDDSYGLSKLKKGQAVSKIFRIEL